ncbi:TIGR03752 family integrating conjugative element protein [Chromohalobacter japonicus]|uniref:TIGR03752 family integrating conjugative element protein n=1 Tax=Chromohalobacter japonicus TaxID=223900 RepID=UPI003CCFE98C
MAPLKSNGLLKVLVPGALVLVILIVVMALGSGDSDDAGGEEEATDPSLVLTDEEKTALGIEADTPRDTVATLVGQLRQTNAEMQQMREESAQLREQNERLAERARNVDQQVEAAMREERARHQSQLNQQSNEQQSVLGTLKRQINQLQSQLDTSGSEDDVPVGLGLEGGGAGAGGGQLAWVEPLDAAPADSRGSMSNEEGPVFPTSFGDAAESVSDTARRAATAAESKVTGEPDASTVEPVYTVPENSTLMGSLGMTALIGRVPIDGTVNDPYPFKAVIGQDNLTANGIEIPELEAAVVSGTATGDWTLSCVRGNIDSMTFVFQDGTIRTVPTPEDVNSGGGGSSRQSGDTTIGGGDSIGWISDAYGTPCVTGERRSNAQEYLGTQSLLTAAGAGVASTLSDDDSTSFTTMGPDGSVTQAMSGNQAVGQILTQGVNDMSNWVNQLYGQAFAAVYVPPGKEVAIHITKQLPIDFETQGRKVHYGHSQAPTYALP